MLGFLRLMSKLIMLCLLYPLRIFKIKNNRILLLNNILNLDAKYSCNPKYMAEYLLENYSDIFEIIYPIGEHLDEIKEKLKDKNITFVKLGSLKYYYYCMTSKFFITTSGAISYIPFRKSQIVINTWHGGGAYKKMGLDASPNFFYKFDCKLTESKTTYFLSTNKYFSKAIQSGLLIPKNKILEIGMPRNDIFFRDYSDTTIKVKRQLGIPDDTRVVVYAPTYRPTSSNLSLIHKLGDYKIDINEVLKTLSDKFGGKWIFGLRLHPSVSKLLKDIPENVINMSDYEDAQEILCVADILINDYSSIMWDFAQTKKPCFIFAEDLAEYENSTGFYTKPSSWPFPLSQNNKELIDNIMSYNEEKYKKNLNDYFNWMGSCENGHACEKICNIIFEAYNQSIK